MRKWVLPGGVTRWTPRSLLRRKQQTRKNASRGCEDEESDSPCQLCRLALNEGGRGVDGDCADGSDEGGGEDDGGVHHFWDGGEFVVCGFLGGVEKVGFVWGARAVCRSVVRCLDVVFLVDRRL